jgi:hypothetical protein
MLVRTRAPAFVGARRLAGVVEGRQVVAGDRTSAAFPAIRAAAAAR